MEDGIRVTGVDDTIVVVRQIMPVVLSYAWLVPAAVSAASIAAFFVPETRSLLPEAAEAASAAIGNKANARDLLQGLIGDGMTQVIGAYFGICGMALGMIVMRRGLFVEPKTGYL